MTSKYEATRDLFHLMNGTLSSTYAALVPRAELNVKLVNDEDQFIPEAPTNWDDSRRKFSLFEYFLAFKYPEIVFQMGVQNAREVVNLFLVNGARYPSDPRTCNKLQREYRELVKLHRNTLQELTLELDKLEHTCGTVAGEAIWDSPVFSEYLPEFLARTYAPGGRLAERASESFQRRSRH